MPTKEHEEKVFTIDELNLEMIKCPAGSFMMGSPENERGREKNETQHKVTISNPFYIGKYPVTRKQYINIMGSIPTNLEEDKGDNRPVVAVNWNTTRDFCEKLNNKYANIIPDGYKFDLPTEAQWEYACRAGTTTRLNFGNITKDVAWYYRNSNNKTHDVGKKNPNAWGLYDMHGNVHEWVRDWYEEFSCLAVTDPTGPASGFHRVIKGGSFESYAWGCRSVFRWYIDPSHEDYRIGFRLALVPID